MLLLRAAAAVDHLGPPQAIADCHAAYNDSVVTQSQIFKSGGGYHVFGCYSDRVTNGCKHDTPVGRYAIGLLRTRTRSISL
ncbi:unnamed protein product [Victoria cruziana]